MRDQTKSPTNEASATDTLEASTDTQTNEKTTRIHTNDGEGDSQGPRDDQYPSGSKLFFIVAALVLAIFLASLDMTIVATAIPKITDEFGGLDKVSCKWQDVMCPLMLHFLQWNV